MCYPKPGPRCSGYAARKLALAEAVAAEHISDMTQFFAAQEAVKAARSEFDATPAGLKALELLLVRENTFGNQQRYREAKHTYTSRLLALKAADRNIEHDVHIEVNKTSPIPTSFLPDDVARKDVSIREVLEVSAKESEPWVNELNDSELAVMRWMTDRGAVEMNTHLGGSNDYSHYSQHDLSLLQNQLDTAFDKLPSQKSRVMYRGIRKGLLPVEIAESYRIPDEVKQQIILEKFQEGATYRNEFYMPTSLQPEATMRFADIGMVMEIKTSRSAPVSALSLFPREAERIIPRGVEYKVAAVKDNILYGKQK